MSRQLPQIFKRNKSGALVRVSPREAKKFIMSAHGWTSEEYTKKRDIFKNKLRAFESFQRAQGKEVKQQNVVEMLYKQAKAMKTHGADYKPSEAIKRIESFSAVSITKGRKQATRQGKAFNAINQRQLNYIKTRFGDIDNPKSKGFVNTNEGAKRIVEAFYKKAEEDGKPVNATKLEEALSDYANAMHVRVDNQGTGETIPSGETYGSDADFAFDIDEYLND